MDRGTGPYRDGKPQRHEDAWQKVANEQWPPDDQARRIKTQDRDNWVTVEVRIIFERDGECWVAGTADRWWQRYVHVSVADSRLQVGGVWVDAGDVRRV